VCTYVRIYEKMSEFPQMYRIPVMELSVIPLNFSFKELLSCCPEKHTFYHYYKIPAKHT